MSTIAPLVSVVIPVYNAQKTILQATESVLAQTFTSYEIIFVNDGSTDNSLALVEQLKANNQHVKITIIDQPNGGAAKARNAGMRVAKGEYIAFLDSDDYWMPYKLSVQVEYLSQNPDVYMLGGRYGKDKLPNRFLMKAGKILRIEIKHQVLKNFFSTPTVIFRKNILDKVGYFDEKMRYSEEGYFFNKIVAYYKGIYMAMDFADSITKKKRWGDSGLSGNVVKMESGELHNIKEAYHSKFIPFTLFLFAYNFSIIKFCRRYIVSMIRKISKYMNSVRK
ncbi:MAG: glycosyltransferase family 2 protein [Prevotellaceae bacterium]|jgi:glycosyltransferase involved in cell wall biosynthesis|nr:glycosyltransferase family 2 protein [Prevotellaceae bacterium]